MIVLSGLGDLIFIFPALAALRATYPRAEIALLALDWHAAFLDQRPSPVDRVIVVPPYGGISARPEEKIQQASLIAFSRPCAAKNLISPASFMAEDASPILL